MNASQRKQVMEHIISYNVISTISALHTLNYYFSHTHLTPRTLNSVVGITVAAAGFVQCFVSSVSFRPCEWETWITNKVFRVFIVHLHPPKPMSWPIKLIRTIKLATPRILNFEQPEWQHQLRAVYGGVFAVTTLHSSSSCISALLGSSPLAIHSSYLSPRRLVFVSSVSVWK